MLNSLFVYLVMALVAAVLLYSIRVDEHRREQPVEPKPSKAMREAERVASKTWQQIDKWQREVKDNR